MGERDWIYRTTFDAPLDDPPSNMSEYALIFEGLDTFAVVSLNGERILKSDNMFHSHRIPVTNLIKKEGNDLVIEFQSAFLEGKRLEEEALGQDRHLVAWNGDPSRLFVRKAGYHYSWDWGPMLMTVIFLPSDLERELTLTLTFFAWQVGPWKPIHLEVYSSRITSL